MTVDLTPEEYEALMHYGMPRRSGRYPWGSGLNPYQSAADFKWAYNELQKKGIAQTTIAGMMGFENTKALRNWVSIASELTSQENVATAKAMAKRGMNPSDIGRELGRNESTIRGWLATSDDPKPDTIRATADALKREIEKKPFLEVGAGVELYMGVSKTRLDSAVELLMAEGYELHHPKVQQATASEGQKTNYRVLVDGTKYESSSDAFKDIVNNIGQIQSPASQTRDGGLTYTLPEFKPKSIDSKKIDVVYGEDGGGTRDGVIEIRRGHPDLNMGESNYAQVRIAVDDTHYLKGMAIYSDSLPDGVDIRFHTPKMKSDTSSPLDVMKPMKVDPETGQIDKTNPFGSSTYTKTYTDSKGKEVNSALNVVGSFGSGNEEGRWDEWSLALSSQFLSKQPISFAREQLGEAYNTKKEKLDEIKALTNTVVREKMLQEFADSADADAVGLQAAAVKGQTNKVLLPFNSIRPNEVYAPGYENGTQVALVRHPHGGIFEIPVLTVNNRNREAKSTIGDARDAVGIHYTVASKLSGADFDGDTVLVIPNDDKRVKHKEPLKGLVGFEPKEEYGGFVQTGETAKGHPVGNFQIMTSTGTQSEMGKASNLITDMTIRGASDEHLTRAVKHSMVVIDAEKHKLDYKRSERENGIAELKKLYQGGANAGASTIVSQASSDLRIDQVRPARANEGGPIDPKTGKLNWVETGKSYVNKDGKTAMTKTTTTKMAWTDDARTLLTKDAKPIEKLYANHANSMKALANDARKLMVNTTHERRSEAAAKLYAPEIKTLSAKLDVALRNAPLEREAQAVARQWSSDRIKANPSMGGDEKKRIKAQSIERAREYTGASKKRVVVTEREWAAIQARAISPSRLKTILANADMDVIQELATPKKNSHFVSSSQAQRMKALRAQNKSYEDIARLLGFSASTVKNHVG